ncbi:MAG TPA: putative PEP-binding protein [Microthrixaceae bacterium]|nr:putative PEP-binding protein [Microthrixaceae bacterium]
MSTTKETELSGASDAIDRAVGSVADPSDRSAIVAALRAVDPADIAEVLSARSLVAGGEVVARGLPASPGRAAGVVRTSLVDALEAWERGEQVVYVVASTSPVDEPAMRVAAAVVTSGGGLASHAAVIARDLGIPAVCGAGVVALDDGTPVVVDGGLGEVRTAEASAVDGPAAQAEEQTAAVDELPASVATLLGWADRVAEDHLDVWANADRADAARRARRMGARGIGLCRIEHMFLGERTALLAQALRGDGPARTAVGEVVSAELDELLAEMDGLPVVVRLLDAPSHEFGSVVESDPMLGVRGVRHAVCDEALARVQAAAIAGAVLARLDAGGDPRVSMIVPLVALPAEQELVGGWVREEIAGAGEAAGVELVVPVGAMIETPRAALAADRVAAHADLFSFGTNDLTQLTYGWGRDDVEAEMLDEYRRRGLLDVSPFTTLDVGGVVRLMALAIDTARAVKPDLEVGLCGEHAADPASIAIALRLGVDHVSCSSYRVPGARLAAAHAVLEAS